MGNAWETEKTTDTTYSNDVDPGANGHSEETLFGLSEPTFDGEVSTADIKETLSALQPPNGTYRTDPEEFGPMTIQTAFDKDDTTRRIVTITGRVRGMFRDRGEITTFLRDKAFRVSPDKRKGYVWIVGEDGKRTKTEERTVKFDGMTNKWMQGADVYIKMFSKAPSEQQLIDFFQSGEYKVVLSNLDGNIYVTKIVPSKGR